MCGLLGHWPINQEPSVDCSAALEALRHRGPDACMSWESDCGLVLGHTRLSFLDLSRAGNQPMTSQSGRLTIVFNGEIYNHAEMRRRITRRNFHGTSDTETLLEFVDEYGLSEAFKILRGTYSFGLWDHGNLTLKLFRDPNGEKPLYYLNDNVGFAFASEIGALKKLRSASFNFNRNSISEYMQFGYISASRTVFDQIHKVRPGTGIEIKLIRGCFEVQNVNIVSPEKQYDTNLLLNENSLSAANYLDELLNQVIKRQLQADVPGGVLLSGGIDSSLIAAIAARQNSGVLRTFTMGFEQPEYDETATAKKIANFLGVEHYSFVVNEADLLGSVEKVLSQSSEPLSDPAQIPLSLLTNTISNEIKYCLAGDGADEIFGGYSSYLYFKRLQRINTLLPRRIKHILSHILSNTTKRKRFQKLSQVLLAQNDMEILENLSSYWLPNENLVIGADYKTRNDGSGDLAVDNFSLDALMQLDQKYYLPNNCLVKSDTCSMANSLELRLPFLDQDIRSFGNRLPENQKISNTTNKVLLRRILSRYLPKELVETKKKGFSVPIDYWLRGPLRDMLFDYLNPAFIKKQGVFDPEVVNGVVRSHLDGNSFASMKLWQILAFQIWQKK